MTRHLGIGLVLLCGVALGETQNQVRSEQGAGQRANAYGNQLHADAQRLRKEAEGQQDENEKKRLLAEAFLKDLQAKEMKEASESMDARAAALGAAMIGLAGIGAAAAMAGMSGGSSDRSSHVPLPYQPPQGSGASSTAPSIDPFLLRELATMESIERK